MKSSYSDAFGDNISGGLIASVNGNTVVLFGGTRHTVSSKTADAIRADIAADEAHVFRQLAANLAA
jgi:hypothetical protein